MGVQQLALIGSSSSLHAEACNALGASDGAIHSSISQEVASLRAATNSHVRSPHTAPARPCATRGGYTHEEREPVAWLMRMAPAVVLRLPHAQTSSTLPPAGPYQHTHIHHIAWTAGALVCRILAEGAIALPVTLSGGALFAS